MALLVLPVTNGLLSKDFERCDYYMMYDSQVGKEVARLDSLQTKEDGSLTKFSWLNSNAVTDLIAYDINAENLVSFFDLKINVFVGVAIATPEQLIGEFERGVLKSNFNSIKAS